MVAEAGYALIPYFGLNLFFHYNHTALAVPDSSSVLLADNSAYVLFYGIEARGILPAGRVIGWASLGISLGSGSLATSATSSDFTGTPVTSREDATLSLNPAPVLGFGAEVELGSGFFVGPELRWYALNADKACDRVSDPTFSSKRCTTDFGAVTVPDVVFIGVGVTYRLGLGG